MNRVKGRLTAKIVTDEEGRVYLEATVDAPIPELEAKVMTTEDLGITRAVEGRFETPEGESIVFDTDYCGEKRSSCSVIPGPINSLKPGVNRIRVW